MRSCIITISREYASGGRTIGKMLADELGLPFFDKQIMHMTAEKSGIPVDVIEKKGESLPSKFLLNLYRLSLSTPSVRVPSAYTSYVAAASAYNKPDSDKLFLVQASVIREIAALGGCVIVGRCASYILKDHPNLLSVFIRGNFGDRVIRAVEMYKLPEKNAVEAVKKIDKHRANYYKLYTERQWGSVDNYDLVLNTSYSSIDGAVAVIKAMSDVKNKLTSVDSSLGNKAP